MTTIAVITLLLISINCSTNNEQQFMTEHNLKIMDTVITQICHSWKEDSLKKDFQVHLVNYSDKDFLNKLDSKIFSDLEKDPKYLEIFSKENVSYFKEQLNQKPNGFYTKLLPPSGCYVMKDELSQEEQIPPPLHRPQDYFISKVVFTQDLNYAIFIMGKEIFGLYIYKNKNGNFEPYDYIYLSIIQSKNLFDITVNAKKDLRQEKV